MHGKVGFTIDQGGPLCGMLCGCPLSVEHVAAPLLVALSNAFAQHFSGGSSSSSSSSEISISAFMSWLVSECRISTVSRLSELTLREAAALPFARLEPRLPAATTPAVTSAFVDATQTVLRSYYARTHQKPLPEPESSKLKQQRQKAAAPSESKGAPATTLSSAAYDRL
jgi:hypothetical protein